MPLQMLDLNLANHLEVFCLSALAKASNKLSKNAKQAQIQSQIQFQKPYSILEIYRQKRSHRV